MGEHLVMQRRKRLRTSPTIRSEFGKPPIDGAMLRRNAPGEAWKRRKDPSADQDRTTPRETSTPTSQHCWRGRTKLGWARAYSADVSCRLTWRDDTP